MKKPYQLALHIFRRDLRLSDNTALIEALTLSTSVIPCFIFDKRQIEHNDYKSDHAIQFMATSLTELDRELKQKNSHLYCFYGLAHDIVARLIETKNVDAVFINRDYTPFSQTRDAQIEKVCKEKPIRLHTFADTLLHEPEEVLKNNHEPYTIFTPFYNKAVEQSVSRPHKNIHTNYFTDAIDFEDTHLLVKLSKKKNPNLMVQGGRKEALTLIKNIKTLTDYAKIRDFPAKKGTTHLSAHNKFGTVSIRELYHAILTELSEPKALLRELYWRDFFTHVGFHFPFVFGKPFQSRYARLSWRHNEKHFQAWCQGETGFPIVDAGMRELNITGFMHNRVRMITASFLTKDLQIDWRLGEKYFAQKLTDYDPSVNNGNWQWAASTGCDAQPYFRIFNPWLQQAKFDPECTYIKRYVPELARVPIKTIHTWYASHATATLKTNYPTPIIDHSIESEKSKTMYKNSF